MTGIILGMASTILFYVYLRRQAQTYRSEWVTVVVAKEAIPAYTNVSPSKLLLITVPPELISPGAIRDSRLVAGKITRYSIHANAQITTGDLMVANEIPGLAIRVPAGKRAIAIAASEVIAVGQMIKPGDRVDVLATYRDPDARMETTQMILQNAPVLAVNIGQMETTAAEGAKTSMTLAVAPEDTERLTAAAVAGQLRVSLRSPADTTLINTPGVTVKDISMGKIRMDDDLPAAAPVKIDVSPAVTPLAPPIAAMEKLHEITIIRGTEVRKMVQ
ncbi:MAG: Flp pilus assembly protein CpaB [Verrucomicrobiota bacterium]